MKYFDCYKAIIRVIIIYFSLLLNVLLEVPTNKFDYHPYQTKVTLELREKPTI